MLGHLGAILCGHGLLGLVRTGDGYADFLRFACFRWCTMGAMVVLLGHLGALGATGLTWIPLALGLGAAVLNRRALLAVRLKLTRPSLGVLLGLIAVALVALRILAGTLLMGPCGVDTTGYHLPKLAHWVQQGTLERPCLDDLRGYFPGGFQTIQLWWVIFWRHDALIELAGVEFLVVGAVAVAGIAKETGLPRDLQWLAGLLYGTIPLHLIQSTACINDIAINTLTLVVLHSILRGDLGGFGAFALGCFIKPTMMYSGVLFLLLPRVQRTGWSRLVFLLPGFLGVYWYLRNALEFGNPIYPAGMSIFGWQPFNEPPGVMPVEGIHGAQQVGTRLDSLALNCSDFFNERLYDAWAPWNHVAARQAAWGWLGIAGFPAIAWCLWRRLLPWRLLVGFAAGFVITMSAVVADVWNTRFVGWCGALPCIALVAAFSRVQMWTRPLGYLLLVGILLNLVGSTAADGFGPSRYRTAASVPLGQRSSTLWSGTREFDGPVAFSGIEYPLYALYGADYRNRVEVIPFRQLSRGSIEATGCRWLVLGIVSPRGRAIVEQLVLDGFLVKHDRNIYEVKR